MYFPVRVLTYRGASWANFISCVSLVNTCEENWHTVVTHETLRATGLRPMQADKTLAAMPFEAYSSLHPAWLDTCSNCIHTYSLQSCMNHSIKTWLTDFSCMPVFQQISQGQSMTLGKLRGVTSQHIKCVSINIETLKSPRREVPSLLLKEPCILRRIDCLESVTKLADTSS